MLNSETKIIIAGFGGQGTVLAGSILAKAAMFEGKNVTQMVSYGAEMRGGTANSTVIISDSAIASPVIDHPDIAIVLNQLSLDKFEDQIVDNGLVVLNSTLVSREVKRSDLDVVEVDATQIALGLGNIRVANIICLGAFIKKTDLLKTESITGAIEDLFSGKKTGLVEINKLALHRGKENCKLLV